MRMVTGFIVVVLGGGMVVAACAEERRPKYPDFGYAPKDHGGPVFRLSQDYPKDLPGQASLPGFFKPELSEEQFRQFYKENWREYLMAVRDYCFEGNHEVDWNVALNAKRTWYHMPWQHWGRFGREALRGLTKEASIKPHQLAPTQPSRGQAYAIAFYNHYAGHMIGKIWEDAESPDVEVMKHPDEPTKVRGFPHGTVIFKLLFADIPLNEVPSLENPVLWHGYITSAFDKEDRDVRPVALIQMDIMVKDDRADYGWLYGTYQYNGKLGRANRWDNLIPVGLQWGNDPDVTGNDHTNPHPVTTRINPAIKESVINPDANELPATHLGWNGRLNGPVDNPRSSCMSCHLTAQHPYQAKRIMPHSALPDPKPGSVEWMAWFKNRDCSDAFDKGLMSTDGSLQLAMSLENFRDWKENRGGKHAPEPAISDAPQSDSAHGRAQSR